MKIVASALKGRWDLYGNSIALVIYSLNQSLSIPLIAVRGEIDDLTTIDRTLHEIARANKREEIGDLESTNRFEDRRWISIVMGLYRAPYSVA